MMNTRKLTLMAMLLGLSLSIFVIESQLPPLAPIPGIKLGLANIITLISLYALGRREAFTVFALRVVLGSVFAGNLVGFIYSACGGALSFAVMSLFMIFIKENSMWVTSVMGAVGHNAGQIAAAVIITKTVQIVWYLPVLMISAVLTGVFTGVLAQILLKRLKKAKENTDA